MPFKTDLRSAITANFTTAQRNRIINALCSAYGYAAVLADGTPNPQSKADFAADRIADYIQAIVQGEERKAAERALAAPAALPID